MASRCELVRQVRGEWLVASLLMILASSYNKLKEH
jgi:hypothetical protein